MAAEMNGETVPGIDDDDGIVRELVIMVNRLESEVEAVKAENDALREALEEEKRVRSQADARLKGELEERYDDALTSEQRQRTQQVATLRQKLGHLADEADVTLSDADLAQDDKLARLAQYGPSDVVENPAKVHFRAGDLLANLNEWADTKVEDMNGRRAHLTSATARSRLKDKRGEQLTSTEVRRVFQKVCELARESPRRVELTKTEGGKNTLVVYFADGGLDA